MKKKSKFTFVHKCAFIFSCISASAITVGSTSSPIEDQQLSPKQLEKKILEEQAKIWPNLKGTDLRNHVAVLFNTPIYDNPKVTEYVQRVGEKILDQTPHAGQKYRFLVLDSPVPNAFTMQQPYIYVNRGLLVLYQNEAQLAGVLGHEVGHNIDKAVDKSRSKRLWDNIFASTVGILAGNSAVGDAIATQQQFGQAKYGQKRELEADRLGAQYLYGAGYDSEGLLEGLGSLFDFVKAGLKTNTVQYRALQSHPRNDIRLRAVLREVGELPPGEAYEGREAYRDMLDGMVYGPNLRPTAPPGYVRYNNEKLGITFLHPNDWVRKVKGAKIIMQNPDETLQFKVEIEKSANKAQSSEETFKEKFPDGLTGLRKIHPQEQKDLGVTAVKGAQRLALAKVARNTFHFTGLTRDNQLTAERDKMFLDMISTFRRMHPRDKNLTEVKRLYFEQLQPGETLGSIANDKTDENVASEVELRAINGYFPKGEPEPGTWIKKIRLEKVDPNDYKNLEKTAQEKKTQA